MKDNTSGLHLSGLPRCRYSAQCANLIDEIDAFSTARWMPPPLSGDEVMHEAVVAQLADHMQTCPTCVATFASARRTRDQQRRALRDLLDEGETKVPSTIPLIMAAVQYEQRSPRLAETTQPLFSDEAREAPVLSNVRRPSRFRSNLRSIFTLATVAVVVLASLSLFGSLAWLRSSAKVASTSPILFPSTGWSSVIMARLSGDGTRRMIENYDPYRGQSVQLLANCCPPNTVFDAISHSGHNLVYRHFDGRNTSYSLLTSQIYTVSGQGSNAVWTTDDRFIFADTPQGVMQFDTSSSVQKKILPSLRAVNLAFYYGNYLYFTRTGKKALDLYRVSVADGQQDFVAQGAAITTSSFWLNPNGVTIYYPVTSGTEEDIYAVNSDGTNVHLLRSNASPVGYAADNALMVVRKVQAKYKLVKLGANPQNDAVVVNDVAPGANVIGDDGIALAPYANALVVLAAYPDASFKLWMTDLKTNQQRVLMTIPAPGKAADLQLIGWSRLQVSGIGSPQSLSNYAIIQIACCRAIACT